MGMPEIVLNSGHKMPAVGFGTGSYPTPPLEELTATIVAAIAAGYRHLDTATMYGQEAAIGRAVAEAVDRGIVGSRDEVFVTSKLNVDDTRHDLVLPALKKTLSELKLDYDDLYLIHWPLTIKKGANMHNLSGEDLLHFDAKEVWEAMEECCNSGLAKSIGVSNFTCAKLSKLLESAAIPPAVNQHGSNRNWCSIATEKSICVTAWSPLGANGAVWGTLDVMKSPVLEEIASSANKTVAQVALRWIVEQGVVPIVKSFNEERMKNNLQIFNWELSGEDCLKIQRIPQSRAFKGDGFVVQNHGDYNTVEELWGGENIMRFPFSAAQDLELSFNGKLQCNFVHASIKLLFD